MKPSRRRSSSSPARSLCASVPLFGGHGADDIGVAGVRDAERAHAEVLAARRAQIDVVAAVVVHARLGQHGVVLDLGLAQRRAVVGDDDELALAASQRLERGGVAQRVLAGLHNQRQPVVDRLLRLLRLLGGHHGAGACARSRPRLPTTVRKGGVRTPTLREKGVPSLRPRPLAKS